MENHLRVTGLQKLFPHTNPSNFRRPLQSLLLRFYYALSARANKVLQKRTVFEFTES